MVLIGKYTFNGLLDYDMRQHVVNQANLILRREGYPREVLELEPRDKYMMLALAMSEVGIPPAMENYRWTAPKRPLLVKTYDQELWDNSRQFIYDSYGVNIDI
jgi:hypothetical protein